MQRVESAPQELGSPRRKGVEFIAVPKCASRAMLDFCKELDVPVHDHSRRKFAWIRNAEWRCHCEELFCVIRDPADRLVSAYNFLRDYPGWEDRVDWRRLESMGSLDDTVKKGLSKFFVKSHMHFWPQTFWVPEQITCLRFSHLEQDLKEFTSARGLPCPKLTRQNSSARTDTYLSDEARRIIREVYADDYKLLESLG